MDVGGDSPGVTVYDPIRPTTQGCTMVITQRRMTPDEFLKLPEIDETGKPPGGSKFAAQRRFLRHDGLRSG